MEIDIINQYMDAAAGIRRLKKEIGILEERLLKAMDKEHGVVSDIVSRGRRGKKSLGSVKITGIGIKEYAMIQNKLEIKRISLRQQEKIFYGLLAETEAFIERIDSIELRNILSFYCIEGMTWKETAYSMNQIYNNKRKYTEDSCRVKYKRYVSTVVKNS